MHFGELQARATVGGRGERVEIHPVFATDAQGRRQAHLIGPGSQVQRRRSELARRNPGWTWTELDLRSMPEAEFEYNLPSNILIDNRMYRLAAKAAFEEYARRRQLRPEVIFSAEFEDIRRFILDGTHPGRASAGLLWHEQLLNGPLRVPVPMHMVGLISHPNDRIFGGFVAFFGLYYYWVCLSTHHFALAAHDSIVLVHAQAGTIMEPPLRANAVPVRVPWREILRDCDDQRAVLRQAGAFAIRKIRRAWEDAEHV